MADSLLKIAVTALAGGLIGWSANALTVVGRVDALEKTVTRMDGKLDKILEQPRQVKP